MGPEPGRRARGQRPEAGLEARDRRPGSRPETGLGARDQRPGSKPETGLGARGRGPGSGPETRFPGEAPPGRWAFIWDVAPFVFWFRKARF